MPQNSQQIIYVVFGPDTYHLEAQFSIASVFACQQGEAGGPPPIRVYTDQPARYAGWPVQTETLDAATLQCWKGPYGYPFRIKQEAIRHCLAHYPGTVVFLDTDTFLQAPAARLFERVRPGQVLCNRVGTRYGDQREIVLYRELAAELAGTGLADDDLRYLNSGVIGLHPVDQGVIEQSLALMDRLYPRVAGAVIFEEFCLAVATYRGHKLAECPDLLHHYWSRKAIFRAKVNAWHNLHGQAPLSADALQACLQVNGDLPRPPAARRLLAKLLTMGMPNLQRQFSLEVLYGCHPYPNPFDRACAGAWWSKALANAEHRNGAPIDTATLQRWLQEPRLALATRRQQQALHAHLLTQV